jgi:hypothetical protein
VGTSVLAAAGDAPVLAHTLALAEEAILLENIIESGNQLSKPQSQSIQLGNRVCNFLTLAGITCSRARSKMHNSTRLDGDGKRKDED